MSWEDFRDIRDGLLFGMVLVVYLKIAVFT